MLTTTPTRGHLLLAAALVLTCGCSHDEPEEVAAAAPVQVAPVRVDSVRRVVEADAVLFPLDQASVTPKISAPVQKFYVNRGDPVKAGQLLATLENRDLTAAAAAAKSAVDQAEANLRSTSAATVPEAVVRAQTDVQSAQEALDAARKVLESRQKLFQEGALARRLVDESQVAYAQAKAQSESAQEHLRALQSVGKQEQVKTAEAQLEAARAQLRAAEAQVAYSEIRSPIGGVIADRPLYAGEMAGAGAPLLTVMDITRVVARANVPQTEAASVKVGDPATIEAKDRDVRMAGKVTVVSPATDPSTTTVQVWVEAANPNARMKPGESVQVAIVTATIPKAVVVPQAAIVSGEEGGSAVLVIRAGSTVNLQAVEIGVRDGDKLQVLSGVSPGDQVVVVGGAGLDDKAKVRIVKPGEKEEKEEDEKK